jgi:hypothetical protein
MKVSSVRIAGSRSDAPLTPKAALHTSLGQTPQEQTRSEASPSANGAIHRPIARSQSLWSSTYMIQASCSCFRLLRQSMALAFDLARESAGRSRLARIRVKPRVNPRLTPPRRGTLSTEELCRLPPHTFKDRRRRPSLWSNVPKQISNPGCRWRRYRLEKHL